MNEQDKLNNMTSLIEQLNEENEKLKKELSETVLSFEMYKNKHDDALNEAEHIILTCGNLIAEYNELIDCLKQTKIKYNNAIKDICILKKKYIKEADKFISEIL